jgi:hypothetical protein
MGSEGQKPNTSKLHSSLRMMSDTFYSQAGQDNFVFVMLYDLLKKNDAGTYLEIGAGYPIENNNTYYFEKNYDWRGVSIDIINNLIPLWNNRKNSLVIADALKIDYASLLASFPKVMDYLSLDIDGFYDEVLEKIPFDEHTFRVITIEHDAYRFGDFYRNREREILQRNGYLLICGDVFTFEVGAFEDWWIHPSCFPEEIIRKLKKLNLNERRYDVILQILKKLKEA